MHCPKKDIVNCLNEKLSQPRTYADVPGKQVRKPNCDIVSVSFDSNNLEIRLDGIHEHNYPSGNERFLSDVKLLTDIVSCLDTTPAYNISNIKWMGPRRYKNLVNKTAEKSESTP